MSKTYVPLPLITESPYQARIDVGDTEGDVPDEVMAEVRAEVDRRLEATAA